MSVLVYIEINNGEVKKASLEAAVYGAKLAQQLGVNCNAIAIAEQVPAGLENCGISKVFHVQDTHAFDPMGHASAVQSAATASAANTIVISNSYTGKSIAPRIAVGLQAGISSGVVALPSSVNPLVVKKGVFSGKAFAHVALTKSTNVLAITPNSIEIEPIQGEATVESFNPELTASSSYTITDTQVQTGTIPLTEAELVVSAGRGMKGPENWGIIEELAGELKAATACSKPVSDMEWRPHSEHVGQTGITIKPNLYIAIGISGAIQHLAGVSSSKVIAVINKDPEAPFFKAADYGIVGDAFEVVPKLIEAAKKLS